MQKFSRHPCGFCRRRLLPIVPQVNAHNTNALREQIGSYARDIDGTESTFMEPSAPFFSFPLVTSADFFVTQVDAILVSLPH